MDRRALIVFFALVKLALHLATSSGYGYFRDELYYIACARHLDWGYVDHPALSILLLERTLAWLGDSLPAIRLLPALAGAATIGCVGAIAGELGGRRFAMVLAMTAALIAPYYLGVDHVYSMNAFDLLFWALAAWLLVRISKEGRRRDWVALGVVLGLGLANKVSVLWLGAGIFVGLLATRERRWLVTPWPFVAGGIACLGMVPYLLWQRSHDWATLEFVHNATSEKMKAIAPLEFLLGQVGMMHPLNLILWVPGLAALFFAARFRSFRSLGWIYVTVLVILIGAGTSRSGYLAPAYTWLLPVGACLVESLVRRPALRTALVTLWVAAGVVLAPLALPLLPVETYIAYAGALGVTASTEERKEVGELPQFYADMHGWSEIVDAVAGVYRTLPERDQERASVYAPDYGIAGALDLLGSERGLPLASSGHNNYWLWGPKGVGEVWIVIGGTEENLARRFERVELALASLDCGYCMPYEAERAVWICRSPKSSISELWSTLKHYD